MDRMNSKIGSLVAFMFAVAGVFFMVKNNFIFSLNPVAITIQICACVLMIWARLTFGKRSFHAIANTTEGKLITSGPYKYFRHPIYASLIYFFWSCIITYHSKEAVVAVLIITVGLYARMLFEESFLMETYPEYASYSQRTKRIIPFLL